MSRARVIRDAAIGAALTAAFVVVVFAVRPLPLVVLRALGVHGGIDMRGGMALRYRLAPGTDPDQIHALRGRLLDTARLAMPEPGVIEIEIPGIARDEIDYTASVLVGGGVEFHAVINMAEPMQDLWARVHDDPAAKQLGIEAEVDQWQADAGGKQSDVYLYGPDRDAIARYIAGSGVAIPPEHEIRFERIVPYEPGLAPYWRTYYLDRTIEVDGWSIRDATTSYDPQTGKPLVLVDFDRTGRDRFAALTTRLTGRKIATVLAGQVVSAPIVNGPILGGRVSITMGGANTSNQEDQAAALVEVLGLGALPPGGELLAARYVAPSVTSTRLWLARGLLGLAAAAVVLVVMIAIGRRSAPAARAFPGAASRPPPWRGLVVTLCAPPVCWFATWIHLPGLDRFYAGEVVEFPDRISDFSAFALGLAPLIEAFVVVELIALAVPAWRALRLTPAGRRSIGVAVVTVAIALAVVHGVHLAHKLADASVGSLPLTRPGASTTIVIALTCAAATLVLGLAAGAIGEYGLGNGFSALTASGILVAVIHEVVWWHPATGIVAAGGASMVIAGAATAWVATRRFGERGGGGGDRLIAAPVAGVLPILWPLALITAIGAGAVVGLSPPAWLLEHLATPGWVIAFVVPLALGLALGWLLVSPRRLAARLARMTATKVAPDVRAWAWAAATSAVLIAGLIAINLIAPDGMTTTVWSGIGAAMIAAAVLDHVAEWRARRRAELVGVWPVHDAAMADVALCVLAGAGIAAHLRGRHHRTLFHVFGPFIPIEVMVPADRAGEASAILRDMFDPASRGVTTAW